MNGHRSDPRLTAPRNTINRRRLLGNTAAATMAGSLAIQSPRFVTANQPAPQGHVQAVVSSDADATQAGLDVLAQGGTAADAAIAVAGVLSVVEPWFSSALGGGTWALYYDAETQSVTSLDGVGPVGSNATLDDYRERVETPGIHHAIVPGAWDGWMLWLDRYGQMDLGTLLEPAINLARNGRAVSEEMARWLAIHEEAILSFPDTSRLYAPDEEIPTAGDVVEQTDMADTFEALVQAYNDASDESRSAAVQAARDYFYRGPLAEAIVAFSEENDGYFTMEDFETFEAEIVEPISIDYDDAITVFQCPPNSQGITMLLALNILKGFDLSELEHDSADAIHLQVEAIKLAFADRYQYIGDPDRVDIPLDELLSEDHAAEQRERINMDTALEWAVESGHTPNLHHTTTFHITDQFGNVAGVTTSLGAQFLVVGDTGIHINERMGFLSLEEGNPNELTPGYKVRHTSCPYLALRNGQPYISGGNTGVDTQPQGQVQQFLNIVEFGMSAQEAVNQPRFISTAFPATTFPYEAQNTLQMQGGFRGSVVGELRSRGHDVDLGEGIFGSANVIVVNEDGTDAEAGAEPGTSMSSGEVIPAES